MRTTGRRHSLQTKTILETDGQGWSWAAWARSVQSVAARSHSLALSISRKPLR